MSLCLMVTVLFYFLCFFFFSSRRRHTRCALVTGVQTCALPISRGDEVVMLSPPGEFGARFAAHGIRWITLPMDRASLNPVRETFTLGALVRVLRAERPDLVHNFTEIGRASCRERVCQYV